MVKRCAKNGEFVLGEENLGYADIGEEEEWDVSGHDDDDIEEGGGRPRTKIRAAQDPGVFFSPPRLPPRSTPPAQYMMFVLRMTS